MVLLSTSLRWFDAWRYENEKYLAVVPFLRTVKIALENKENNTNNTSKTYGRWNAVKQSLEKTFAAFINSTNINFGYGSYASTEINLRLG